MQRISTYFKQANHTISVDPICPQPRRRQHHGQVDEQDPPGEGGGTNNRNNT